MEGSNRHTMDQLLDKVASLEAGAEAEAKRQSELSANLARDLEEVKTKHTTLSQALTESDEQLRSLSEHQAELPDNYSLVALFSLFLSFLSFKSSVWVHLATLHLGYVGKNDG